MKKPLRVQVVQVPRENARRSWDSALDLLADAFAQRILDKSRAEAAAELGLTPSEVAPDPNGIAEIARAHGLSLVGGDR
ncbi:MAG: hypothetical protein ABMB14_05050 [Myxococcota bacterium]